MSRSPRSAHLQMCEDRRQEQLQRAREKDRLKEMQAKLERHPLGKLDSLDMPGWLLMYLMWLWIKTYNYHSLGDEHAVTIYLPS